MNCETYVEDGVEYIESGAERFALGLNPDEYIPCRSLGEHIPILSETEIKRRVTERKFKFGRDHFDGEWTFNQNGYGKCAASGATSGCEKANYIKTGKRVRLSDDYLYSRVNGNRDRGSTLSENRQQIMSGGICLRETVKPGEIYRRQYNTAKADKEALRFRAMECFTVNSAQEVWTALLNKCIVVIAIHVGRNWRRFDRNGVLIGDRGPGNHCEHLDDLRLNPDTGELEGRKASSHGLSYGEDGFCWVKPWHFMTVHSSHQKYAIPTMHDDPLGDNPFNYGQINDDPLPQAKLTVMSNRATCHWCAKWEDNELSKVEALGIEVAKGSLPGRGIPRFRLDVGGRAVEHAGYWRVSEIERAIGELTADAVFSVSP